jgi:hypothetical protein
MLLTNNPGMALMPRPTHAARARAENLKKAVQRENLIASVISIKKIHWLTKTRKPIK